MPRISLFAALALAGGTLAMPAPAAATETQIVQSFERTLMQTIGYKYLLALPVGYDARGGREWPLIVFLHGSGERGDDVWSVARHGPAKLLRASPRESVGQQLAEQFVVVSPQCPKNTWWDTTALLALLDEVQAKHRIDPRRVYLTGLSMGGFAAWELAGLHPERFAAVAPICGGGQLASFFMAMTHKRQDLRRLPFWVFHGAKDETVPVAESERMVEILKRFQVREVQFTVYPDARHDSWTETYANPELYAWFLRHARPESEPAR
jgi:predicted peptidase